MSDLTINGIVLSVRPGPSVTPEEIGERGRAFDGTPFSAIRAVKQHGSFTTTPLAKATAEAFRKLLTGHHAYNWSFEATDNYSLQGHAPTLANGAARSTAQYKFGAASMLIPVATSGTAAWTVGVDAAWSVAFWMKDTGWHHYVLTSTGVKYIDGVAGAWTIDFIAVSAGVLTLSKGSAVVDLYFDDLLYVPFVVPADWPLQQTNHAAQLSALPILAAAGDVLPASMTAIGHVTSVRPLQLGGTLYETLDFDLSEV